MARYDEFIEAVRNRLVSGELEYGEQMYGYPVERIVREAEQELFDLVAWVAPLYERLKSIKMLVEMSEKMLPKHFSEKSKESR